MRVILASRSPRRRELLLQMGIGPFEILVSDAPEVAPPGLAPGELVEHLSAQKAAASAALADDDDLLIASDTIVVLDGTVLGKPRDEAEAFSMLRRLSGRTHHVYTGLALRQGDRLRTAHECTAVHFRSLTDAEIRAYIATKECLDKAGAYGIQGRGSLLVEGIEGDFFTVVGLPVCRLGQMLREFGLDPLQEKADRIVSD